MAKKPRTPAPPRVQAPQRRDARGRDDRRARWILYGAAALGPVALAVVLLVIFLGGGDGTSAKAQTLAAGCTLKKYPLLNGTHVSSENAKVKWNSWPPTSGAHYGAPAPFNFYDEAVNPRISLHNLEHGGIGIFYGRNVPASQIDQLRSFWRDDPNGLLIAPMPELDPNITVPRPLPSYANKIVAAAWTSKPYTDSSERQGQKGNGFLLTCSRFDEKTFTEFRDIHRTKGPERFPLNLLAPGS